MCRTICFANEAFRVCGERDLPPSHPWVSPWSAPTMRNLSSLQLLFAMSPSLSVCALLFLEQALILAS